MSRGIVVLFIMFVVMFPLTVFGADADVQVDGILSINGTGSYLLFPDNSWQDTAAHGTITGVTAGTGLTGGGIAGNVAVSIDPTTVQSRVTGTCTSGYMTSVNQNGTVTCQPDANSGGTVTSVSAGSGLNGGTITTSGTISIASGGVANAMLANPTVTVTAGTGLSGGGTIALGGSTTLGLAGVLSIANGGTGSATQNFVDLITNQTVGGAKTFSGNLSLPSLTMSGNLTLPATTATTGIIKSGLNALIHTYGSYNFFAGIYAGNLTMTGANNTASGYQSLFSNTTGNANTASGTSALSSNTTGFFNTASGTSALYSNTTGVFNTASGTNALHVSNASYNTASGADALQSNTTGSNNTASGAYALSSNTTGEYNTASGTSALSSNTTGSNNTALGFQAGDSYQTGSTNTFIGASSDAGVDGLTNATAIGANAIVSQSNSLVLGSVGTKVGIGTTTPHDTLDVNGTLRMNDNDIYLRGNSDSNHGLGWYGNGFGRQFKSTTFAEGPVLYGFTAGALGTSNGSGNIALKWQDNGNVTVYGALSKASGSFKIDHPLDRRNKYLYHSFVESPDMMNIYNGNVVTDGHGFVTVVLPEWFQALNRDFRYQLTVLDEMDTDEFVQAKIVRKISGNSFTIRTSNPDTEVSWQVTGIRKDAYAEKHRIPVEEEKPAEEKGTCLHPEACGE